MSFIWICRSVAEFTDQEIAQPLKSLNDKHTKSRKEVLNFNFKIHFS